jgi:hypothetical protein
MFTTHVKVVIRVRTVLDETPVKAKSSSMPQCDWVAGQVEFGWNGFYFILGMDEIVDHSGVCMLHSQHGECYGGGFKHAKEDC